MFKQIIKTRYNETGQDGIIHHSNYVVYLEVARCEFLKQLGCDLNVYERNKIFSPVINISINYLKPLLSLEDIEVSISVKSHTKVRFCLAYEIMRGNTLVTTAETTHCFTNKDFKPIAIPEELFQSLQRQVI